MDLEKHKMQPNKSRYSLRKKLHQNSETILPAHSSDKDQFALYLCDKICKIHYACPTSDCASDVTTLAPPAFNAFEPEV